MLKKNILFIGLIFSFFVCFTQNHNHQLKIDYVPDTITAMKIAEAVWLPIYGKEIYTKMPFKAKLINGKIWQVEGTLKETHGGVPMVMIQKSDGKIILVTHGK
jgi:hypothetical protein